MNIINKLKIFISLFILIFLTSCQFLNQDVKNFFRDYTETAAIDKIELYKTFPIDNQNVSCFDSTSEQRVHLYLRNPQRYSSLKFTYEFNDSFISSFERSVPSAVTFVPLNSMYSEYDIVFSEEFLQRVDNGEVTNGSEVIKDISGTVKILETNTMREFENYDIFLRADSLPPEPVISLFQLSEPSGGKFILCLAFPKIEGTVHENDTHKLYIGSNCWSFNGNFNGLSGDFLTSTPSNLYPLEAGGYTFDNFTGNPDYQYLYFDTGINFSSDEIVYDVGFEDDHQLKNLTKISNKSEQLIPVTFDFAENDVLHADESGYATTTIHHNGLTEEGSYAGGGITIHYTVYDNTTTPPTVIDSATGTDPSVKVKIPYGTDFKISAYATKPYYVSSASASVSSFKVARSPIYYVSDSGDNAGMGTKASPYRTIQKAVDEINNQIGIFGKIDSGYTINILSDITPDTSDTDTNLVNFAVTNNPTITIRGVNSNGSATNRKIDAMGTDLSKKRIFNITGNNNITLENLTLTGGYADNSGGAVNISSSHGETNIINLRNVIITGNAVTSTYENSYGNFGGAGLFFGDGYDDKSTVTLENCTITNNKALGTAVGGGILSKTNAGTYSYGNLILKGNTIIQNNSSESNGGGVYCSNTLKLESSTKITNNVSQNDGAGLFVHKDAAVTISGKVNITENKKVDTINSSTIPSNVYLQEDAVLNTSGSLSGSKIGITTEKQPEKDSPITIAIPETYSSAFKSDLNFSIRKNSLNHKIVVSFDSGNLNGPDDGSGLKFTLNTDSIIYTENTIINVITTYKGSQVTLEDFQIDWLSRGENIGLHFTTPEFTIPAGKLLPGEQYEVKASGKYNGTKYGGSLYITAVEDELLSALTANPSYVPSSGETINISSGKAISQIATWVNSGESLEGVEFKLENDVTLPENFETIGLITNNATNTPYQFKGSFDGNGKTITIKSLKSGSTALFGFIDKTSTIENLTLAGDLNITGNFYGFVNYCQDNVIIKNCVNKCNVTATGSVAGFTSGISKDSYIENCRNEGNLTSTGGMAAGISISGGSGSYKLKKCSNAGKITGKSYVGGIMAQKPFVTNIMNCYNEGEITGESYVGGIAGSCYTNSSKKGITNCYNTGTVTAKQYAGGIVGSTYNTTGDYAYCAISNCVNYGTVTCTDNPSSAGGIIGLVHQIYQDEPSRITFAGNFYLEGSASSDIGEQSLVVDGNRKLTTSNIDSVLTDLNYWVNSLNSSYESALLSWKKDNNNYLILDMGN